MVVLINARAKVNISGVTQFAELASRLSPELQEQIKTAWRNELFPKFLNKVARYPAPASPNRWWQSRKQQQAYFATEGFGKGIPHVRTGNLRYSWRYKTRSTATLVQIQFYNEAEGLTFHDGIPAVALYEQFVTGQHQQRMFMVDGWPQREVLTPKIMNEGFKIARLIVQGSIAK